VGAAVLAVGAVVFALEQRAIAAVNGWWLDELCSMWATEPGQSLAHAYRDRISHDPTPPLYYLVLYAARVVFPMPFERERVVVLCLNLCFIAAMAVGVVWASRRAGLSGLAMAGVAAFLLSGAVLRYAPDARAYLMAMTLVFTVSWLTALAIEDEEHGIAYGWFAGLGAVAGVTHFFAALMCCSLGAGLVAVGMWRRRRELTWSGIALGAPAFAVYAGWFYFLSAPETMDIITWIRFDALSVTLAYTQVRRLAVGSRPALALACAVIGWGVVQRGTRALSTTFGIAMALFVGVPLLISLKVPVISARYWLIGAPALVVYLVFAARAAMVEAMRRSGRRGAGPLLLGVGALGLLVATSVTGYEYALYYIKAKYVFRGAEIVKPLLPGCSAGTIHVYRNEWEYLEIAREPEGYFVDADRPATGMLRAGDAGCRVLGWAEQVDDPGWESKPDGELLRMMKIDAQPGEVEIARHLAGFVVLRRGE
jgi:hypothetical protein